MIVVDDPSGGEYPMAIDGAGRDEVLVGQRQAQMAGSGHGDRQAKRAARVVGRAPQAAVHGVELEQLQGVLDAAGRAVRGVRLRREIHRRS